MTRVLVINSPLFRHHDPSYQEDSIPPLGLGYIVYALREAGIEVELIDAVASRVPLSALTQMVEERSPSHVAINVFTTNLHLVKEFIEGLNVPECSFIVGGIATRTLFEKIFSWNTRNSIDVVFGDGELITQDIVLNRLKEPPVCAMPKRRYFAITDKSVYFVNDISNVFFDRKDFVNEPLIHPRGFTEAHVITSRGCIYNCAYCAAARSINKDISVRVRSDESIIRELDEIKSDASNVPRSIRIVDDLFLRDRAAILKATDIFSEFSYQWRAMAHIKTFEKADPTSLDKLRESGCQELFIGIESGSPRILSRIGKTNEINIIEGSLGKLFKANIAVKGYFIYGFPGETFEDCEMTFKLASSLKEVASANGTNFRTSVFKFRPYHGTRLYDELVASGLNPDKLIDFVPDHVLSDLVGRRQFNFDSGNYSTVEPSVIDDYIDRTSKL